MRRTEKGGTELNRQPIPVNQKVLLTINEAAEYIGIGHTALRKYLDGKENEFCVRVGNRRLVKREKLEQHIKNNVTAL